MNTLIYRGKLDHYLKAPLYVIVLFVLGDIALFFLNIKLALLAIPCILVYALVIWAFYRWNREQLNREIINFATRYGTVQKELLGKLEIPYALLDTNGRFLWRNEAFFQLAGEDSDFQKSVTSLFGEINKDRIAAIGEDPLVFGLKSDHHTYRATLQQLTIDNFREKKEVTDSLNLSMDRVIAFMLFDETRLVALRQKNIDQELAVAQVSIDNYEETIDSVEAVRRALLVALIDRKVNKYFQSSDAIVRKNDRDKYIVLFQRQYLAKMEEDRFSILEEIKNTKAGNDNEITLSIGIGLGGRSYTQNTEYARAAMDLALGRGGSQAAIKSGDEIRYYGIRGREVEKNTRVKARVKAQALREIMTSRDTILVMGHKITDIDAFGAAVGVYVAARELGKEARIVVDTVTSSLRPLVSLFTGDRGYPEHMIISPEEALQIVDKHTLVVVVDTNRPNYTVAPDLLNRTRHIVVFDHHRQGEEVVQNPVLSYIEPYASSACEMIAEVLQYFSEKVQLRPTEADCIYAGILIDTDNFAAKVGVRTFEAAAYLRRNGADVIRVRKMLREDMATYKARAQVVRDAEVYHDHYAVAICETTEVESPTIVGAQAANELLNIVGIKASFVITDYRGKVYISARSIDEVDVQKLMEQLGGGGHLNIAGAQIAGADIDEVKQKLIGLIDEHVDKGDL
ncbi:GGDEF domain-containing protein [Shuttleworthella satelles]|uniref:Cyclic-di-AMP phosphodiesterase n=1 Tax=Shuttleworthella satelles DSM 14600 TaxID=626523 RepID=C4GC56_9FIRM|nr:DHH family phosphoesterase [Shuttleworthia satelles]EEP27998.1 DHHA1 domain protein [Shuttleworthia satelles DSM 14600]